MYRVRIMWREVVVDVSGCQVFGGGSKESMECISRGLVMCYMKKGNVLEETKDEFDFLTS